jgi:hypothetical protein
MSEYLRGIQPFTSWAFPAVREVAGDACHIAAWLCGRASVVPLFLNPGDIRPALQARLESGMDVVTASREVSAYRRDDVRVRAEAAS